MHRTIIILALGLICVGCYTLPIYTPDCTHNDQPIYSFDAIPDGHHYVFNKGDSKLAASVNIKDGYLSGKFEIYYRTGIFKYRGMLDTKGHVLSGDYNDYMLKLYESDIRSMTVADKQNAQTELLHLMRTGVINDINNAEEYQLRFVDMKDANEANDSSRKKPSLVDCVKSDSHPVIGEIYLHDGKRLEVFQVIDDGVMVRGYAGDLDIVVTSGRGYVDGEMLAAGKYEYVGPYTYETIKKAMRTIRLFKEVE